MSSNNSTKVVNIKLEKYEVYIGRRGKGQDGRFGNPVISGKKCCVCSLYHNTPQDTIPCYSRYFISRINTDVSFRKDILSLKGKVLGCFCKPNKCHGDVIIDWLNSEVQIN